MTTDDTIVCRYHGRDFTTGEMALMRELIASSPQQTRAGLARAFCRAVGWVKPDGGLKAMAARVAMLRMHRDGIITLPPPRHGQPPRRVPEFGPETDPPATPMPETLDAVRPDPPAQGHRCRPCRQCRMEQLHRPLALPRLHAPDRRTDALYGPGPGRPAPGHARLLGRRLEDRTPR